MAEKLSILLEIIIKILVFPLFLISELYDFLSKIKDKYKSNNKKKCYLKENRQKKTEEEMIKEIMNTFNGR